VAAKETAMAVMAMVMATVTVTRACACHPHTPEEVCFVYVRSPFGVGGQQRAGGQAGRKGRRVGEQVLFIVLI